MTFSPYPPKRDCLLYVARHWAVTLTCDAPFLKALRPGLSVSKVEPSGVCFSWYWLSSSRSLGHSLLLGQRSRLNFLSDLVRSLFHQHHRGSHTEFVSHRYNGHFSGRRTRVSFANRTKEFSQLAVLADRRPRRLNEFSSQSGISTVSNRAAIGSLSGGSLGGNQTQKGRQLANVFDLAPVPDASHELASHDPAEPGKRFQILDTARQLRVVLTMAANRAGAPKTDLAAVKSRPALVRSFFHAPSVAYTRD